MTPPHIEKAARLLEQYIEDNTDTNYSPIGVMDAGFAIELTVDRQRLQSIATLVWSLARAHTIEEAAKRAENWSDAQHMAHDMRTGVFPKQTKVHDAIAAAIRALAVEG